ncbi:MAG TPA: hypothetical protein VFC46_04035 [Humisphaera sp.]|nr:hypothetical protein [Humisphaera sp.]
MIVDTDGNIQPVIGTSPHWAIYHAVARHPDLAEPMRMAIMRSIGQVQTGQEVDSRRVVAAALDSLDSWWHGEFPRRFSHFENGAERGIMGMILWNHLAELPDRWSFCSIADPHGYGQDALRYWRC